MKKLAVLICALICFVLNIPAAQAVEAEDISGENLVESYRGIESIGRLFDGRFMESVKALGGGYLTLNHEAGIGSLYILFDQEGCGYTVINEDTGEQYDAGETVFLHEFIDLQEIFGDTPSCVTIVFDKEDTKLCEVHAFTSGETPDWVQKWMPPAEGESDLALFSTHGDDEQLFFAGMLPYYARELGYNVQVVYMTGHRNMSMRRSHEMLDGLWAVGVRNYPVFGPFGDYNSGSKEEAYQTYRNKNISKEDILSFVVENVRRFRPKVAVGHDLYGEYGHGMHMIYAELLCEASEISMDPAAFPESAERYGIWDIPKTYLHLYWENQIRMGWDIPLESFDGMTAYEVTRDLGFSCHVSQQTYYSNYFAGMDTASDIMENSPCEFGLYRSTVGEDLEKRDFFENVTTHGEDALRELRKQGEEKLQQQQIPEEAMPEQTQMPESIPAQIVVQQEIRSEANEVPLLYLILAVISAFLLVFVGIKMLRNKKKKFLKKSEKRACIF